MYVKVYMSDQEKTTLSRLAEKRGLALSQLIYAQLLPLLHDEAEDMAAFDTLSDIAEPAAITQTLTLHLSGPEMSLLQKQAKGTPLSVYVRYLLFKTRTPAVIEIVSDDIAALSLMVSSYLEQLRNFAAALYVRNELFDADRNRLMEIAANTETALRQAAAHTWTNRKAIRASGSRWLRKELKRILTADARTVPRGPAGLTMDSGPPARNGTGGVSVEL